MGRQDHQGPPRILRRWKEPGVRAHECESRFGRLSVRPMHLRRVPRYRLHADITARMAIGQRQITLLLTFHPSSGYAIGARYLIVYVPRYARN